MGSTVISNPPFQGHVFGKKVQLLGGRSIGEEKVTDHILNRAVRQCGPPSPGWVAAEAVPHIAQDLGK